MTVANTDELELESLVVPGDPSSAAFWVAAGVLVPGSRLVIRNVGANWTRTGFMRIVERMGGIVLGDLEARLEADTEARIAAQADLVARLRPHATRLIDTSGSLAESRSRVHAAWAAATQRASA